MLVQRRALDTMQIARHPAATRGAPALAGNSLATSETSNPSLQSPTQHPPRADPHHSQANLGVPHSRSVATLPVASCSSLASLQTSTASRPSPASTCAALAPTSTSYAIGEKKPRASAELGCNNHSAPSNKPRVRRLRSVFRLPFVPCPRTPRVSIGASEPMTGSHA